MRARPASLVAAAFLAVVACGAGDDDDDDGDGCSKPDQDGIIGGDAVFEVNVSDTTFAPLILKAQNSANVTLKVTNTGTRPHGFMVECLVLAGCSACFPDAAKIAPLDPGASTTVKFVAPEVEGIYTVASEGDSFTGQFILQ